MTITDLCKQIGILCSLESRTLEQDKELLELSNQLVLLLVKDIDLREFRQHLALASKIVESWPAWKRNILINSGKSTCDVPREPVTNNHINYVSDGY